MNEASEVYKILVIEDEKDIRELIAMQLARPNRHIQSVATGAQAKGLIESEVFDLFIIDRMLPDTNGLELCRELRDNPATASTPILMLTALSEPENIIEGLDAGADDYITKPFDLDVFRARVRAQLRRNQERPAALRFGELFIDEDKRKVTIGEEEIKLTNTEMEILIFLARKPGIARKRKDLINEVLGEQVHVTARTIDTHIAGLRKKLGPCSELIETIRGVGYRFQEQK